MQPVSDFTAEIKIKNLRLRTYIGIKDDEIRNQQDVVINVIIQYDASKAITDNCIESALNYRTITKKIIQYVQEGRFALLERMTQDVLDIIMSHEQVNEARVEIDKPHALRFSDSVSVSLMARRELDSGLN
ncbi:MAG: dihydroneopterin triphosphate 2'-epimerase [Pseudomonadales bacterium]|uniref:Dihydroneopterin triphosphate 2'-epimerase n=1 Tax=Oleiphilus messinensis TaxID=141451 RepID=A0A1Y0I2N5_9GAMM|nr:dihydroneopterin triphosphate 2'-epimerase [Oleiphilus messinensis]ARU54520.1 D-erythro-7,8-dihydroneopterin triphosphate 2'-epimerase [Oleiphilus messinensis]MCG8612173.1 dihydroneopterin triphosphate 2'-epimerase [Pseudomonadales bacterium]